MTVPLTDQSDLPPPQVAGQVTIGHRFFETAIKDYENPAWAFVREIMQNSIDAHATNIKWEFRWPEDGLEVTVSDDGSGMDRDTLVDKLLSLGGSGKEFANGAVGGFGKAKELLFFCHHSYRIETRDLIVEGSGASYTITESDDFPVDGTQVTVRMHPRFDLPRVFQALEKWASLARWPGNLTYHNHSDPHSRCTYLSTYHRKGSARREFPFGKVYSNRSAPHRFVCRLHGMPMFHSYTDFEGTVILELNPAVPSDEVLTANRDGLKFPFSSDLRQFLAEISTDKRTALRNEYPRYHYYSGERLGHNSEPQNISSHVMAGEEFLLALATTPPLNSDRPTTAVNVAESQEFEPAAISIGLGTEFIIKNTTGLQTPSYFQPSQPDFGHYPQTLARYWIRCIMQLHQLFEHSATFSVGFILTEDLVAEYETKGPYGNVYYLNPAHVVTQNRSASRSFKKRWQLTDRHAVLAVAVHEFIHGLGYSRHDEDYAAKLTTVMGEVMKNLKKFNACFAA